MKVWELAARWVLYGTVALLISAAAGAVILTAASPAFATSLVTYQLENVTGQASDVYETPQVVTDALTGTFTFDTTPYGLGTTAIDVDISGGYPWGLTPPYTITHPDNYAEVSGDQPYNGTYQLWLALDFLNPLGDSPDPVSAILLSTDGLGFLSLSDVTGTAVPLDTTPIASSVVLLATGLGALGLLGWRTRRKASAVVI